MNLLDIFSSDDKNLRDKFAAHYRNQTGFSSGASKLARTRTIKKLKMEPGDGLMVVPLFLHLPIDFDGNALKEGIPYVGTIESAISSVKFLCNNNAKYADTLKELIGNDNFTQLNLADVASVSKAEMDIFYGFRKPLVYAATVMSVKAADSKFAFGTPYRVPGIATSPDGNFIDDIKNPLIYKLHKLETACIAAQIKSMNEQNEAAGDSKRTDADMAASIKSLWDNRCISNPYNLGTSRVLWFKTDRNFDVDKDILKAWEKNASSVKKAECYIKVNTHILEQFESQIGTKYDRYDDFLLIKQTTPAFDDKDRGSAAQKISRTGAGRDEAIEESLEEFVSAYQDYRNDMEAWSEDIIMKSAFEYRTISDDTIRTIFKNSMPALSAAMHTAEIVDTFGDTIALVDNTISDKLMENAMDGSLSTIGDISTEIASAPIVTENTPGYGGDSIGCDEDASAIMDALVSDT